MISIEEIESKVVFELLKYFESIKPDMQEESEQGSFLGDTTFLLGALLDRILKKEFDDWNDGKWIDDAYIKRFYRDNSKVCIWGVMIWGRDNTTEQWTDPFYFEIELIKNENIFKRYTFLFCDLKKEGIKYSEYCRNPNYWDVVDRDWKYIINSTPRFS